MMRKRVEHSDEYNLISSMRWEYRSVSAEDIRTFYRDRHKYKKLRKQGKKAKPNPYHTLCKYQKCIELRCKMLSKEPPKPLHTFSVSELTVTAVKNYISVLKKYEPTSNSIEAIHAVKEISGIRQVADAIRSAKKVHYLESHRMPFYSNGIHYTIEEINTNRIFPLSVKQYTKFAGKIFYGQSRKFSKYFKDNDAIADGKDATRKIRNIAVEFGCESRRKYYSNRESTIGFVIFKDSTTGKLRFSFTI